MSCDRAGKGGETFKNTCKPISFGARGFPRSRINEFGLKILKLASLSSVRRVEMEWPKRGILKYDGKRIKFVGSDSLSSQCEQVSRSYNFSMTRDA